MPVLTSLKRSCLLTVFCVLCVIPRIVCAQNSSGNTILGKVRTPSGQTVSNIIVELQSGNGMLIAQTVTSNEGDYAFTGLTGASFSITVNDFRHEPFSERVEFPREASTRPGETIRTDIVLIPKSRPSETRGAVIFRQDVPEAAARAYQSALKLFSESKGNEAIAALKEAIKLFPNYFDAHVLLAQELIKQKEYQEAIVELDRARSINPKDDRPYELFGIALMRQGKYVLAARVFAEAANLNPFEPQYPFMRAVALVEHVSSTKIVSPANLDSDSSYALAEAEKSLLHAYDISHKKLSAVHFQLARVYEKRGERERAARELEEYLRENPNLTNAAAIRDAIKKLRAPAQTP